MPNRLAAEKSPYLLQHANNPVDWYPWGPEAFEKARREGKPIFLSIGYSTCHWCHVMERESFENDEIAALMNKLFVNIKVDREERPDVDRVYMTFVQATTGGGGWPMSVWLTPELKPFYGGTYFPPRDNYGRPGFPTLLEAIARTWSEKREDVLESASDVVERMRGLRTGGKERAKLSSDTLKSGSHVFAHAYDAEHGGFGNAPKFPRPVVLTFLLAEHVRRKDPHSLAMVVKTLKEMSAGGMYDHLGGGFHRYSVDRFWHVPHFEKMLYDQAQLVDALVDAWQLTRDADFARVIRETCEYVLRDLTDAATGGFFSAEDADSPVPGNPHERAEGAFYVFTDAEIGQVLDADAAKLFRAAYDIDPEGNADDPHGELTGKNVLHRGNAKVSPDEEASLAASRARLLAHRNQRPRPHLDDKILCAWNGLMIGALARAARALGEPRWLAAASRAADFVLATLWKDGELLRRYRAGEAAFEAHLEDHAALARGLTDLYEASFERKYLDAAVAIVEKMNALFLDGEDGGWFDTSGRDPSVLLRSKDDYDGAEPAGNSLAALVSLRLAEHTGREAWRENAARALACFSARLNEQPHAAPLMLTAFGWLLDGPTHVVIAGERGADAMRDVLDRAYIPRRVVLRSGDASWTADMDSKNDSATVYVCRDRACERPVNTPSALEELLSRLAPAAS